MGDIVPADCLIIEGDYLSVDQSMLTGESLPVDRKEGDTIFSSSTVKVLAIITGVTSKQISGKSIAEDQQLKEKQEVEDELGITFLS